MNTSRSDVPAPYFMRHGPECLVSYVSGIRVCLSDVSLMGISNS